jgi:hypothetical protein
MSNTEQNQSIENRGWHDDLKLIHGIGSGVEARLNAAGIHTYAQLAELTTDGVAEILKGLVGITPARIARQAWAEQAALYAGADKPQAEPQEEDVPASRQYYETFTIELLLDEESSVRRTRITHVRDAAQESWAGFSIEKMLDFFSSSANLTLLQLAPEKAGESEAEESIAVATSSSPKSQIDLAIIDLLSQETHTSTHLLTKDQPFDLLLKLELSGFPPVNGDKVTVPYTAMVYARQLGSKDKHEVCHVEDTYDVHSGSQIKLHARGLPTGVYRIVADLNVSLPGIPAEPVTSQGSLLQVF